MKSDKETKLIMQIADFADSHAILATHLLEIPKLKIPGIKRKHITAARCRMADSHNAREVQKIIDQYCPPAFQKRIPALVKEVKPDYDSRSAEKRKRIFGFPITSVVRWMGKEGWTLDEARIAIRTLNCDITDSTLRTQLTAGKNGKRGEPAKLSISETEELYSTLEEEAE